MTLVMTEVITHHSNRSLPREELRGRIYTVALRIFREKGFGAATVEEIARSAGVAKGTVFNFFPTKGALLFAYYREIEAKFGAAMAKMSPADPKAALVRFYGETEMRLRAEGRLVDDIFRELAAGAAASEASGDRNREALVAFFRACRERGTLSPDVEPAVAGHIVSDLWHATVGDWLKCGRSYSLRLRLAAKLEALFKGLAPAARPNGE